MTAKNWATLMAVRSKGLMGADRRDQGLANAAAAIAGANGGKVKPEDVMPLKFWRDNTPEEDAEMFMQFADMHNKDFRGN